MSRENVEIVRRYLEDFPPAPERLTEWVASFWEPDGDYYPVRKFPEARPCHGREEIERFAREFSAAWERYEHEIKSVRLIPDDRVLAHARILASGRESGAPFEGDVYYCCWLRQGRFIRMEDHLTLTGALKALGVEAAGLSE